jgi:hypothetical protein
VGGQFDHLAKGLVALGIIIGAIGLVLLFIPKIPFIGEYIGRLPGDIYIKRENLSFYFPITTGIIVSIIISVLLYIFRK